MGQTDESALEAPQALQLGSQGPWLSRGPDGPPVRRGGGLDGQGRTYAVLEARTRGVAVYKGH